jgi:Tfp pilus assembly protein PilF
LRLAFDLEKIRQFDLAEWAFRRAAEDSPPDDKTVPNSYGLVLFLAHRGKIKEAVDYCDKNLWPNRAIRERLAILCGSILCDPAVPVDEEQTRRVIGWFDNAAREAPQSMTYHLGLANLHERLGDYSAAAQEYRTAIKINDRDGIAANNLAWLLILNDGSRDEALALIEGAIRARGGPIPEYLDTRGMVFLARGQAQRALEDLLAAFRRAPTTPKYFHLAQAHLNLGNKEKARNILKAGKARGLPTGLHRLEVDEYNKIVGELGIP